MQYQLHNVQPGKQEQAVARRGAYILSHVGVRRLSLDIVKPVLSGDSYTCMYYDVIQPHFMA